MRIGIDLFSLDRPGGNFGEEAFQKIIAVLASTEKQKTIREFLDGQRALFTLERFQNNLQNIVRSEISPTSQQS